MERGHFGLAGAAGRLTPLNLSGYFRLGATAPGNNRAVAAFTGGDRKREAGSVRRSLGRPTPFHVFDAV